MKQFIKLKELGQILILLVSIVLVKMSLKHSPMEHKIRIPQLYGNKTILDLKVQRFICKNCRKTWVVDCPLVPKNSNNFL